MLALKWALSAACLALGLTFVGPSEAQPGTFTLRVCNNTEDPAMLAIIHRGGVNDRHFVVKGCSTLSRDAMKPRDSRKATSISSPSCPERKLTGVATARTRVSATAGISSAWQRRIMLAGMARC